MANKGIEFRKRRENGEEVKLPTGMTVVLRQVSLQALMLRGDIPDSLTGLMAEMILGKIDTTDPLRTARGAIDLNFKLCQEALVSPRIVEKPTGDDEISFDDLTEQEVNFIVAWAQEPQRAMEAFRQESAEDVGSVHIGEELPNASESSSELGRAGR